MDQASGTLASLTKEELNIQRKLKVPRHAEKIGDVEKYQCSGICMPSFYLWKASL
ncbi:hypothetical protein MCEGE11_00375 [Sphingomonadaceae bacterium]